eukprot:s7022_g2.t1
MLDSWFAPFELQIHGPQELFFASCLARALLRELPSKSAWSTLAFLVRQAQDRSAAKKAKEQKEAGAKKRKLEAVWFSPSIRRALLPGAFASGTPSAEGSRLRLPAKSVRRLGRILAHQQHPCRDKNQNRDIGAPSLKDRQVSEITSTSATILWSNNQDARKAHIDVLLEKKGSSLPFAFFEASGDAASFELPEGSLPKSAGPFRAQVVLESGPADRPQLTEPGMSEPFCTPAEPPSAVVCLRLLGEPRADGFTVEWQPPADDGGNPVEVYEVHLSSSQKDEGVPAERAQVRIANGKSPILCHSTQQCFSGLAPGSDYTVEVCAVAAGVSSALATIEVSTACAAPAAPSQLRARLMPGWARTSQGCICIAGEGPASPDLDVVKLEFMSPASDGGQPVQAYTIHGEEELCEDAPDVEDATESLPKSGAILRSIQVMASSMSWCAEVSRIRFVAHSKLRACQEGQEAVAGWSAWYVRQLEWAQPLAAGKACELPADHGGSPEISDGHLAANQCLNWSLDQALDVFFAEGNSFGAAPQEHLDAKSLVSFETLYSGTEATSGAEDHVVAICGHLQARRLNEHRLQVARLRGA